MTQDEFITQAKELINSNSWQKIKFQLFDLWTQYIEDNEEEIVKKYIEEQIKDLVTVDEIALGEKV